MALAEPSHKRRAESVVDIPEVREYASEADADLDEALEAAVEAADEAGHDYLSAALRYELGSFYLSAGSSE